MRPLLAVLLLVPAARAATLWPSGDYHGDTDIIVGNGDTLSGTYTNVRLFSVPANVTVSIAPLLSGPNLAIYASTISISGVVNAVGRGQAGGGGGQASLGAGLNGTGGGSAGEGFGTAGTPQQGGGGGAGGGAGGSGAGDSGGGGAAGGAPYGSTGTVTLPLSADDLFQGSGGGGGGANATTPGGSGAPGGGAIYLEASSVTITGSIVVDGSTASAVTYAVNNAHPGAGGGGGGGSIILRVTGQLTLADGARLSAKGGGGGNIDSNFIKQKEPGGGGGGGRIKYFYATEAIGAVVLSTAAGVAGGIDTSLGFQGTVDASTPPGAGFDGTVSSGVVASPASAFAASSVYVTSISWTWSGTASFGDADAASRLYRVFAATETAPLVTPQTTASSLSAGATESALTPNTTYFRFVTAFSEWGDSARSNSVSTHTLAAVPAPAASPFSGLGTTDLTLTWTAGSPSNPSYTVYELDASTSSVFAAPVSTGFTTSISSSPSSLSPNTTYFYRVRAVNLDGVPTSYTATEATATLAAVPAGAAVGPMFITSGVFTWSAGGNPPDTQYLAQVSSDNFFSLTDSSATLMTSATFFTLSPGTQYFLRVEAINRNSVASAFSTVLSTAAGN
ncbi:MAG TPA: hypothetical protein VN915_05935, partial [Elusimicrobiota bacterium]|nr:hypothetical protein [Elusimicrobiota bacterium]